LGKSLLQGRFRNPPYRERLKSILTPPEKGPEALDGIPGLFRLPQILHALRLFLLQGCKPPAEFLEAPVNLTDQVFRWKAGIKLFRFKEFVFCDSIPPVPFEGLDEAQDLPPQ